MTKQIDSLVGRVASMTVEKQLVHYMSQIASKSLFSEMRVQPDNYWTHIEDYLSRSATVLSTMTETQAISDPSSFDKLKNSTLRLASLWENLSTLRDDAFGDLFLINSAVMYALGGYQANAACLAKKYSGRPGSDSTLGYQASLLLQRKFLTLQQKSEQFAKEPDTEYTAADLGLAAASRGFGECSGYFLSGSEQHMTNAISYMADAQRVFSELGLVSESILLHSMQSLLPIIKPRSTWEILKEYRDDFVWNRYLKLLARGLKDNILCGTSISELWPSQIEAVKSGLLDTTASKIIRMPTSSGKTRIAEMAMINTLSSEKSKCVYIAPYRALVSELEDSFLNVFCDLGYRVSSIAGHYEHDQFEEQIIRDADILVSTPEKLDLLFRRHSQFLDNAKLFVIDEGHTIDDSGRGIKLEMLLSKLRQRYSDSRFLVLSAVLSDDTIRDFLAWFNLSGELVKSDWQPTLLRRAKFAWSTNGTNTGTLEYYPAKENKLMDVKAENIIEPRQYTWKNEKTGRRNTKTFPAMEKNETAAELGFKFSSMGSVLISSTTTNSVMSIAAALERRLEYTLNAGEQIPDYLQNVNAGSIKVSQEWLGKEHQITRLLKSGIAVHHGKLPDMLKRAIERDARRGSLRVIVATNTLSQGVNFPIRTVIIHSCRRYANGRMARIPAKEYWNLIGRAGRAGYETNGTAIHLIKTPADANDYEFFMKNKTEPNATTSELYRALRDLIDRRISSDDLKARIDPEILGMLAEESFSSFDEPLDRMISSTLAGKIAKREERYDKLHGIFREKALEIKASLKDDEIRVYGKTGLSSSSCMLIRDYILNKKATIAEMLDRDSSAADFAALVLEALYDIPEMHARLSFAGDKKELLEMWISGKSFDDMRNELKITDALSASKFIEEYFGSLVPWGASAFLQIMCFKLELSMKSLPDSMQFLPGLIKYGVPLQEACWAMQLGISNRKTALKIAVQYRNKSTQSAIAGFIEWMRNLDSKTLPDAGALFFDDAAKTILRVGDNRYLRERQSLQQVIQEPAVVRAETEKQKLMISTIKENQDIHIVRDYDNLRDRNAIKIQCGGENLGLLDNGVSQYLAPLMDTGTALEGKVAETMNEHAIKIQISEHGRPA